MICEYGCGQEARHRFKNGKWCCNKSQNSCPNIKNKISEAEKGRIFSEISKEKMSLSLKGKPKSEIHRENISLAKRGILKGDENKREKNQKYSQKWREKNREKLKSYRIDFKKSCLLEWLPILKEKFGKIKCAKCSYSSFEGLCFHHINGKEKKYKPSSLLQRKPTPERIAEFDKCEILCANCHAKKHNELDDKIQKIIDNINSEKIELKIWTGPSEKSEKLTVGKIKEILKNIPEQFYFTISNMDWVFWEIDWENRVIDFERDYRDG